MTKRLLAVALAASAVLAGCSQAEQSDPFGRHDFGTPGFVRSITNGVDFYPACGNETLTVGTEVWYQYDPANIEEFPNPKRTLEAWGSGELESLGEEDLDVGVGAGIAPAVAAPGPGDDVGTLIIYNGDIAYWQSYSDNLATWLTTHEIEYNWVC